MEPLYLGAPSFLHFCFTEIGSLSNVGTMNREFKSQLSPGNPDFTMHPSADRLQLLLLSGAHVRNQLVGAKRNSAWQRACVKTMTTTLTSNTQEKSTS
jgi:hypothetical protein